MTPDPHTRPHLAIYSAGQKVHALPLDRSRFIIGRDPGCHLMLDNSEVSRQHAVFMVETGPAYFIQDENSANGTKLNGSTLRGRSQVYFSDRISIGPFELVLETTGSPSEPSWSSDSDDALPVPPPLEETMPNTPNLSAPVEVAPRGAPQVIGLNGMVRGARYRGWGQRLVFGRGEGFQQGFVFCPDTSASKEHAEIRLENGAWVLRDLKSKNGTFLNGIPIMHPQALRSGDRIGVGTFEFRFKLPPPWMSLQPLAYAVIALVLLVCGLILYILLRAR